MKFLTSAICLCASLAAASADEEQGRNLKYKSCPRGQVSTKDGLRCRLFGFEWKQVGSDFEVNNDNPFLPPGLVPPVAPRAQLSDNGQFLVVSASENSEEGIFFAGLLKVYRRTGKSKWSQVGQTFRGEAEFSSLGSGIDISSNGRTMTLRADGEVKVFAFVNAFNHWVQVEDAITLEDEESSFGPSLSMAGNGKSVVVGAPRINENDGLVRVLSFVDGEWTNVFEQSNSMQMDQVGATVSFSADGSTFAAAATTDDATPEDEFGSSEFRGSVTVYRRNPKTNEFKQLGPTIPGSSPTAMAGIAVSMSRSGDVVAVGEGSFLESMGTVIVYRYNKKHNKWVQLGNAIEGMDAEDLLGFDGVSLSFNGQTMAVPQFGLTRVYTLRNQKWVQVGQDLADTTGGATLSSNGKTVSVTGANFAQVWSLDRSAY